MTFRMFNQINERLKASHDLEFCYEPSKKHFKEGIGRTTIPDIDLDRDIEKFLIKSEFEIKRHKPGYYNFYQVYPCDCAYVGYSLVAANSVEDANRIIQDFKNSDPHNDRDSYAYGDVSESDLIEDLISTREGIILEGFYHTGN